MNLTPAEKDDLLAMVNEALDILYQNDMSLIKRRGMEMSIGFRLGLYLAEIIKKIDWLPNDINIDMEYNKNGENTKSTRLQDINRPDIIIHKRERNDKNYLMIELKGWWSIPSKDKEDLEKLQEFTDQSYEYQYGLGLFIKIKKNRLATIIKKYINGKEAE